jgi:hypothetical protein
MITNIFVNLPVKDLNKTVEFFTKLGFTFNPQFTDENATCMIVGKDIFVMLLVEKFFKTFTKKEISDTTTAEELGFVRASLLVIAFLVFGYQGYRVSEKAPDMFSRLTAVGITTWIVSQAMINVAAMLSIIPLTGVPLPFISYGSSSTWMLMLASGILLNISKHTQGETRESRSLRRRHWWAYFAGAGSN